MEQKKGFHVHVTKLVIKDSKKQVKTINLDKVCTCPVEHFAFSNRKHDHEANEHDFTEDHKERILIGVSVHLKGDHRMIMKNTTTRWELKDDVN